MDRMIHPKLESSGVAPLVAGARGYEVLDSVSGVAAMRDRMGLDGREAFVRDMRTASAAGALLIPLYPFDTLREFGAPAPATWQMRPNQPIPGKGGAARKYIFRSGVSIPIDVHPAVPPSWLDQPAQVFVTEGTLKADSAFSAWMIDSGIATPDELAQVDAPFERLRRILEEVDPTDRTVVLSIAGVANWHSSPEWNTLRMKGSTVYVAFDGDAATNPAVWRQASQLWEFIERRHGLPRYVRLDDADDAKIGVDDFLVGGGTWQDLTLHNATEGLPPQPMGHVSASKGEWRCDLDKRETLEYVPTTDHQGNTVGGTWRLAVGFSGRLDRIVTTRESSPTEQRSGVVDADAGFGEEEAVIEIGVGGHSPSLYSVRGPATILADPPDRWHTRRGTRLPAGVVSLPEWPPKPAFTHALKAAAPDRVLHTNRWTHWGWVPTHDARRPAFLVGSQAIGPEGFLDEFASPATSVTDETLSGASKFGVWLADSQDELRRSVIEVVDRFVGDRAVFRDRRVGAALLAAMLRPTAPLPSSVSIMLIGPPKGGKSWSAAAVLAGWQAEPGTWTEKSLPGSANDTPASIEAAVSSTSIWVADDLAPSPDRAKANAQETAISDLVRAIHNKSARRRMRPDMTAQAQRTPRALVIVTAENPLSVASAADRVIVLPAPPGSLVDSEFNDFVSWRDNSGDAAIVVGEVIRHLATRISDAGWPKVVESVRQTREGLQARAIEALGGNGGATRHAAMSADLSLGISALTQVAAHLGLDDQVETLSGMYDEISALVAEHHEAQSVRTPGASLFDALRQILASGKAHIIAPGSGGVPSSDPLTNQLLGWTLAADAPARGSGPPIGWLLTRNGSEHVVFDPSSAFAAAQRENPSTIPYGQKEASSWRGLIDEGYASSDIPREGIKSRVQVRTNEGTSVRLAGIAVDLVRLLGE